MLCCKCLKTYKAAPDTHHKHTLTKYRRQWPCMIYGRKRRKALRGCNTEAYMREIRQSTHALVWTLTYLHLNLNGSKFFRSLMETPKNGDLERRSQVEEPFSPEFSVLCLKHWYRLDSRSRKVCWEFEQLNWSYVDQLLKVSFLRLQYVYLFLWSRQH